jgi:hypothetical protein
MRGSLARTARGLAVLILTVCLGACPAPLQPPPQIRECIWNSDCRSPLACVSGLCAQECKSSQDCHRGYYCRRELWWEGRFVRDAQSGEANALNVPITRDDFRSYRLAANEVLPIDAVAGVYGSCHPSVGINDPTAPIAQSTAPGTSSLGSGGYGGSEVAPGALEPPREDPRSAIQPGATDPQDNPGTPQDAPG